MKNKFIVLVIFITCANIMFAQQKITTYYDFLKKHIKESYTLDQNGMYHGEYLAYYTDGKINAKIMYNHGNRHGKDILYYNQYGSYGLAHVYNWKDDSQEGLQQEYTDDDGNQYYKYVKTEILVKDGKRQWKRIYNIGDNGKRFIALEESYDGVKKAFYKDGRQWYEINDNGRNFQDPNVGTHLEFTNVKGKKYGLYREWYPNDQLHFECNYLYDNIDGEFRTYDEMGKLQSVDYYIMGKKLDKIDSSKTVTDGSGHFKMFSDSGWLLIEGTKISGQLQGVVTYYKEDGRVRRTVEYRDGKLNGKMTTYYNVSYSSLRKTYCWCGGNNSYENGLDLECMRNDSLNTHAIASEYFYKDGILDGICYPLYSWEEGYKMDEKGEVIMSKCNKFILLSIEQNDTVTKADTIIANYENKPIRYKKIYCGNSLKAYIIGEGTIRENWEKGELISRHSYYNRSWY